MIFYILFILIMLTGCDNNCRKVLWFENEEGLSVSNCINKKGKLNYQRKYKGEEFLSYIGYSKNGLIDTCFFEFRLNHKNDTLFIEDTFSLKIIYDTITYNRFYDRIRVDIFKDEKNLFITLVPNKNDINISSKDLPNTSVFKIKISPFIKKEGSVSLDYRSDSIYIKFDE